jgi:hypothetical protein
VSVTLTIYLFGKPGMELEEGAEVTPEQLRALGDDLRARLHETAEVVEKLTNAGWQAEMLLYDVMFSHPYVTSAVQAEEKLHELEIDPDKLCIDEWEDEEEGWEEGEGEEETPPERQ